MLPQYVVDQLPNLHSNVYPQWQVTITSFKPLTATEGAISSRMTSLVARNLKEGVHPFIIPVVGFTYADNKANLISVPVETTELKAYIDRNRPSRDDRLSLVSLHKTHLLHIYSNLMRLIGSGCL